MIIAAAVLVALFLGFIYRLRGGGFVTLGSDTACRVIWAVALGGAYVILAYMHSPISYIYAGIITLAGFIGLTIPHAYAQNVGRWPTPQKGWPSFFLPTLTNAEWAAMPLIEREAYDMASLACIGFLRGAVAFAPGFLFLPWLNCALAIGTMAVLHPIAYFLGYYMPFTLTSSIQKKTAEWGEFLTGIAWGVAVIILVFLP